MKVEKTRTPCKVKWEKPFEGWLKLNVDSSCQGNLGSSGGGGGIIQDWSGNIKATFLEKIVLGTHNSVEFQAIVSGIRLRKELVFQNICIELDFALVVGWLKAKFCSIWYS